MTVLQNYITSCVLVNNRVNTANPNGTLSLPSSVILKGSGFEPITNPKPTAYDTFSDYVGLVDGDVVPKTGGDRWLNVGGVYGTNYKLDANKALGSRAFSFASTGVKALLTAPIKRSDGPPAAHDKLYVTWNIQFNEALTVPPQNNTGAHKLCRIWDHSSGDKMRMSYVAKAQGYLVYDNRGAAENVDMAHEYPSEAAWSDPNKYHRCEIYIDDVAGTHTLWIDGKKVMTASGTGHGIDSLLDDNYYIQVLGFDQRQASDSTTTLRHWLAEFYQQPSLARVELSNSPIYDDTVEQLRVYQRSESRSDNEIVIPEMFYGELDQSSPIYAYIVKTDGSVISYGQILEVETKSINGVGFGVGPDIILFDRFDGGSHGDPIVLGSPLIGDWYNDDINSFGAVTGTTYYEHDNRGWMATRLLSALTSPTTKAATGLTFRSFQELEEFRFSFRYKLPTGMKFPGCENPNTTNNGSSNWKLNWFGRWEEGAATGASVGQPDIIIPTNGSASQTVIGGNHFKAQTYDPADPQGDSIYFARSGTEENFISYYQKPESVEGLWDGTIDVVDTHGAGTQRRVSDEANPFYEHNGDIPNHSYNMFTFNGWMGNVGTGNTATYENVLPLMTDAYLAVGPNSRATIYLTDEPTLSASNKIYEIPPKSWTDTRIEYQPKPYEDLPYRHIIMANGTLRENV